MTLHLEKVVGGRGIKGSLEHPCPTQPHRWRRFFSPTAQKRLTRSQSCLSVFDSIGGMSVCVFAAEAVQKSPQHESVWRLSFAPLDIQEHALNMWPPSSKLICTTKSLIHFKHVNFFLGMFAVLMSEEKWRPFPLKDIKLACKLPYQKRWNTRPASALPKSCLERSHNKEWSDISSVHLMGEMRWKGCYTGQLASAQLWPLRPFWSAAVTVGGKNTTHPSQSDEGSIRLKNHNKKILQRY